jgi:hypothetical protein
MGYTLFSEDSFRNTVPANPRTQAHRYQECCPVHLEKQISTSVFLRTAYDLSCAAALLDATEKSVEKSK